MAANKVVIKRVDQIKTSQDSSWKDVKIGIYNIDEMILHYIKNVIVPRVDYKSEVVNVPVMYGTPERWKSVQYDEGIRNDRGVIQCPIIMIKRTGLSRNDDIPTTKIDAQNPQIFRTFEKRYTSENNYSHFNLLHNDKKVRELKQVVIPDYVTVEYAVIMWTDFLEQMNKLIELFTYHGGSYWGNDYFRFVSQVNDFDDNTEMSSTTQRTVKTEFNLSVKGYILPDSYLKRLSNTKEFTVGPVKVSFKIT